MTNKVKTNKVKLEVEKELFSSQTVEFSTRFNQEQVDTWVRLRTEEDFWLNVCGYEGWLDGDPLITFQSPQVEDGQGDDHCPFDDEIQEWINENE
jgi:hypothetical protein